MKRSYKFLIMLLSLALLGLTNGCTVDVPGGHVGKVKSPSGFDGDLLSPGRHPAWGHDIMYFIEVSDKQLSVEINQLTTDRINFKAVIGVLFAVDRTNKKAMDEAFGNITPAGQFNTITAQQLFETYVKPLADQEARGIYSKYASTEVVKNRQNIVEEVKTAITAKFTGGLIIVKQVTVNNDDFPLEVTKAWENRAQESIGVEIEKAKQSRKMIEKENALALEQIDYEIQLVKAANIADANRIIGNSISPGYLAWWQLDVLGKAASGPNNWGFIPYTDYTNGKGADILASRTSLSGLVDAELMKRIGDARAKAGDLNKEQQANSSADATAPAPNLDQGPPTTGH